MTALKKFTVITKATFGGAACGLVLGVYGGMVISFVVWPFSNLGPLAGMALGLPLGTCVGLLIGFVKGVSVTCPKKSGSR